MLSYNKIEKDDISIRNVSFLGLNRLPDQINHSLHLWSNPFVAVAEHLTPESDFRQIDAEPDQCAALQVCLHKIFRQIGNADAPVQQLAD